METYQTQPTSYFQQEIKHFLICFKTSTLHMIYEVHTVLDIKLMPLKMVEMLQNPQTMTQNTSCDNVPHKESLCTII